MVMKYVSKTIIDDDDDNNDDVEEDNDELSHVAFVMIDCYSDTLTPRRTKSSPRFRSECLLLACLALS